MKDKFKQKREEFLTKYFKKYKSNFKVQKFIEFPYEWLDYGSPEYKAFIKTEQFVNHREVFPDEILTDIDSHDKDSEQEKRKSTLKLRDIIIHRLNHLHNLNYTCWGSGGTGWHFHLFFPELLNYSNNDRRILKREFRKLLGTKYLRSKSKQGHVCHGAALVQAEYSPHRKGGYKMFFCENTTGDNKLHAKVFEMFKQEKEKLGKMELKTLKGKDDIPKCVRYLETKDFSKVSDGHNRAAFVLAATYSHLLGKKELLEHLRNWNKNILGNRIKDYSLIKTVKSIKPGLPIHYVKELLDDLGVEMDYSDCIKK